MTRPTRLLIVIDANLWFAAVTQIAGMLQLTGEVPPLVVAGVGYDLDSIYSDSTAFTTLLFRRSRDNLAVTVDLTRMPRVMTEPSGGGATHLLDALIEDVLPAIEASVGSLSGPHAVMGHSGGGHFSLYAALRRPDVFDCAVAGTPVLFSYDLFDAVASEWAKTPDAERTRLFVGIGALEPAANVDDIHRFVEHLSAIAPPGAQITSHIFEDETHNSVWPAIYARGLRCVLGGFRAGQAGEPPVLTRDT